MVTTAHERLEEAAGWTSAQIQELLAKNDRAVQRALVVLYRRQTPTEREEKATRERNGQGFSQMDALFLSKLALQTLNKVPLTVRQLEVLRKPWSTHYESSLIGKYHRQLLEAVLEKKERSRT